MPPSACIARVPARRPTRGGWGRRRARRTAMRRRRAEVGRRTVDEPVDRADEQLVVGQLDDERHDRRGARRRRNRPTPARRGSCGPSRSGGDRRRAPRARAATDGGDRSDTAGSSTRQSSWRDAVGVDRDLEGVARDGQEVGEAGGERQAPDRVEVGAASRAAARDGRCGPSAGCARGGGCRRRRVVPGRRETERAEHPGVRRREPSSASKVMRYA